MLAEADVLEALSACFTANHPFHRPLNAVELGLVASILLERDDEAPGAGIPGVPPRQRLILGLIPCSVDEDANAMLVAQIENRMAGLPELSHTTIEWLAAPKWTTERISPELRQALKLDPPMFPILNNG